MFDISKLTFAVAASALLTLAACSAPPAPVATQAPSDTGNMAYPAPSPAGNLRTTIAR